MSPIAPQRGDARVRLRPETLPKWVAITTEKRWTFSEAADALADEFLARHGIRVGQSAGEPSGALRSPGEPLNGSPSIPERTDHDPALEPVSSSTRNEAARRPTAAGHSPPPDTAPAPETEP